MLNYINEYSIALFNVAKEFKKVDLFKKQITLIKDVFVNNDSYIDLLSSHKIEALEKQKLLKLAFKKNIDLQIYNFLFLLIDKNYIKNVDKIIDKFIHMVNIENKVESGIIYSTYKLPPNDLNKIIKTISLQFKNKINFINKIDKNLLGGIKVIVNNNIIDFSILNSLKDIKNNLLNSKE